jgi:Domain of unknown function (DUF1877)
MGMLLVYCRVSLRNAETLLKHPALIHPFIVREVEEPVFQKRGFFRSLFRRHVAEKKELPLLEARPEEDEGDADKAWQGIHYLLTGTPDGGSFPQNFILYGGRQVGDEEVGYGTARIFSPAEVREIDRELQSHTEESLHARYDGPAMDEELVYPRIWSREAGKNFSYAWENFLLMREFIQATRASGEHLMLYLS